MGDIGGRGAVRDFLWIGCQGPKGGLEDMGNNDDDFHTINTQCR